MKFINIFEIISGLCVLYGFLSIFCDINFAELFNNHEPNVRENTERTTRSVPCAINFVWLFNNHKPNVRENTESERTIRRVRCARIESDLDKLFNK